MKRRMFDEEDLLITRRCGCEEIVECGSLMPLLNVALGAVHLLCTDHLKTPSSRSTPYWSASRSIEGHEAWMSWCLERSGCFDDHAKARRARRLEPRMDTDFFISHKKQRLGEMRSVACDHAKPPSTQRKLF
jgi:hypothetical protein